MLKIADRFLDFTHCGECILEIITECKFFGKNEMRSFPTSISYSFKYTFLPFVFFLKDERHLCIKFLRNEYSSNFFTTTIFLWIHKRLRNKQRSQIRNKNYK